VADLQRAAVVLILPIALELFVNPTIRRAIPIS
jgi:hypothetical protein